MEVYVSGSEQFEEKRKALLDRFFDITEIEEKVREIRESIRKDGDSALVEYTKRWDGMDLSDSGFEVTKEERRKAWDAVSDEVIDALKVAAERIRRYQSKRLPESWFMEEGGSLMGERITPLEKVGIYVPGGKASYPSTVLMNAVPAKVAGVKEIIMVTPFPHGEYDPSVLVAADIAGVDRIFRIGGAQAIFALAYGTESIPRVDKIVGPGNIYVATAKKMVYGVVDIDMIAGPSEILVVALDGNPEWIAADLMSQAEHDEMAYPVIVTLSENLAGKVKDQFERMVLKNPRRNIIEKSSQRGGILVFRDEEEMFDFVNQFAPEHLELIGVRVERAMERIKNAGAIFIGDYSSEPVGDYLAGPDHTLPTGGTARFFSPLGVEDFLKRSSIIAVDGEWLKKYGDKVIALAEKEGLPAHANAVRVRLNQLKKDLK